MGVYDDVSTFCDVYSPTSTVSTSSSSGLASPVYENVEELTGLCSRSWKMMGKRTSKPSMSDLLAQIPPPPPRDFDAENGYEGFMKRGEGTSTASSSASSRRPIVSKPRGGCVPQPPAPPPPPSCPASVPPATSSNTSVPRLFDMRPLSLPHKEMQRIEREQSHRSVLILSNRFDIPDYYAFTPACPARVLIITLLIITIFIVLIALSVYVFFDDIEAHINNIAGSF